MTDSSQDGAAATPVSTEAAGAGAGVSGNTKRFLPWIVASSLFMEQLDATIVNTGIPSMAADLGTTPLALRSVSASYVLALAVSIPASGWLANRFGTRRVFLTAIVVFTLASLACGLAPTASLLVACRVLQGMSAALMMPVGRMTLVRTFPKAELLRAMNFVVMPALMGPLLGPTVGGLIVHWGSWREMFFVNIPVGMLALAFGRWHMPDFRDKNVPRFDIKGWLLFGGGTALLSWVLEVFGEHGMGISSALGWLALSAGLMVAYVAYSRRRRAPLLNLNLFQVRTFRVSVVGGFITRLGIGGMPFLLPLLYQVGMGLPAWHSGLLMMPTSAGAMVMKALAQRLLGRLGYRRVLTINTWMVAACITTFSLVSNSTPTVAIVALSLIMGLANSLQFTSMNTMAYADLADKDTADGSTIASTFQQMSLSFGLACGSLTAGFFLDRFGSGSGSLATLQALHYTFVLLGLLTLFSSLLFRTLRDDDGDNVSRPEMADASQAKERAGRNSSYSTEL